MKNSPVISDWYYSSFHGILVQLFMPYYKKSLESNLCIGN